MAERWTGGAREQEGDEARLKEFESRIDPNNKEQVSLLEEMRAHTEKLAGYRKHEDPRLSFSTPEFKEASRIFTDNFKRNFDKPIEWAMVKEYPWQQAVLQKLAHPVDTLGNLWPLDEMGKPILAA